MPRSRARSPSNWERKRIWCNNCLGGHSLFEFPHHRPSNKIGTMVLVNDCLNFGACRSSRHKGEKLSLKPLKEEMSRKRSLYRITRVVLWEVLLNHPPLKWCRSYLKRISSSPFRAMGGVVPSKPLGESRSRII